MAQDRLGAIPAGFYDHAPARLRYQAAVISAQPKTALAFQDARADISGKVTYVSVRKGQTDFEVRFASDPDISSAGDMVFRRSLERGTIMDIRLELDPGIGSYLLLKPQVNDRTLLSLYVDGRAAVSGIILKSSIFYLYTADVSKIARLAGDAVPWDLAFSAILDGQPAVGGAD